MISWRGGHNDCTECLVVDRQFCLTEVDLMAELTLYTIKAILLNRFWDHWTNETCYLKWHIVGHGALDTLYWIQSFSTQKPNLARASNALCGQNFLQSPSAIDLQTHLALEWTNCSATLHYPSFWLLACLIYSLIRSLIYDTQCEAAISFMPCLIILGLVGHAPLFTKLNTVQSNCKVSGQLRSFSYYRPPCLQWHRLEWQIDYSDSFWVQ